MADKKLLYLCLLIIAVIVVILGFSLNPSFVSKHLSADGILAKRTEIRIYILQSFCVALGFIILLYSLIKITKRGYGERIDKKIANLACQLSLRSVLICTVFLVLTMTTGLRILNLHGNWQRAWGGEYLWIAQNIARGHGFSFASCQRWGFVDHKSPVPCDEYFPTAHEEPVYPLILALFYKSMGKHGELAMLAIQLLLLFLTAIVIYYLGRKVFNFHTAILAVFVISTWSAARHLADGAFIPSIFAGFMISISAYLILWCLEGVSVRRGTFLGVFLGLSSLTFAPILLFIPLSVLLLLFRARHLRITAWQTALSVLLAACIVLSPWAFRNLMTFGKFIPVKTGLGHIAHQSNPILAATFSLGQDACSEDLGPLWRARNGREAIMVVSKNQEKRIEILNRSFNCIELKAPDGYETFNEAQRDQVYLERTLEFLFSNPKKSFHLAYSRILTFFAGWTQKQSIVSIFALIAVIISFLDQRARVLLFLVLTYASTFLIVAPWFYRYRYPIEPILILLASYVPVFAITKFYPIIRNFSKGKCELMERA